MSQKNNEQLKAENDKLQNQIIDLKVQIKAYEQKKKNSRGQNIKMAKRLVKWWAGGELTSSFHKLYDELPIVSKQTFAEISASIVRRFTRLGFFAILFALIPFLFLVIQTFILNRQTILLNNQNKKIDTQIYLEEASRRNNLVFLMDNILQNVNMELDKKKDKKLSKSLIGRIGALSQGFQSYRFLEGDTLSRSLNPERGQFLLALANSDMDTTSLDAIYKKATFKNAYLKGAFLDNLYLSGADLGGADLSYTDLNQTNLSADLRYADLKYSMLIGADLTNAHLAGADLANAYLLFANLVGANLEGTNLKGTSLENANLEGVKVKESNWIEKLKEWKVIGYEEIKEKYVLSEKKKGKFESAYYEIELKVK